MPGIIRIKCVYGILLGPEEKLALLYANTFGPKRLAKAVAKLNKDNGLEGAEPFFTGDQPKSYYQRHNAGVSLGPHQLVLGFDTTMKPKGDLSKCQWYEWHYLDNNSMP